jgi:O-antigen/teichoic acid export membrane protein
MSNVALLKFKSKFSKESLSVIVIKSIGLLLKFGLAVLLARYLGPEKYGIFSITMSILVILSIPIQAGLPSFIVRKISKFRAYNDANSCNELVNSTIKKIFIYLIVLSIPYFLVLKFGNFDKYQDILKMGIIFILLSSLVVLFSSVLRGMGRNIAGIVSEELIKPGLTLLFLFLFVTIYSVNMIGSYEAFSFYILAIFFALLFSWSIVKKFSSQRLKDNFQLKPYKIKNKEVLYIFTIIGGIQLLQGNLDVVAIGFLLNEGEAGIYKIVIQLSNLVVFGLTAINQLLQPKFSELYEMKNNTALQELVYYSSTMIFILGLLATIIFIVFGEYIIEILFGESYISGISSLTILVLAQLINVVFGSVAALLNMTGNERLTMKILIISLLINIILDLILIPIYGIEGAAIANAISLIVWNVKLTTYVTNKLGIYSSRIVYLMYVIKKIL